MTDIIGRMTVITIINRFITSKQFRMELD